MSKGNQRGMSLAEQLQVANREAAGLLNDGRKLLKEMRTAHRELTEFVDTELPKIIDRIMDGGALGVLVAVESKIRVAAAVDGLIYPEFEKIRKALEELGMTISEHQPEFAGILARTATTKRPEREVVITGMRIDTKAPSVLIQEAAKTLRKLKCVKHKCDYCADEVWIVPAALNAAAESVQNGAIQKIACMPCAQKNYNASGGEWVNVTELPF